MQQKKLSAFFVSVLCIQTVCKTDREFDETVAVFVLRALVRVGKIGQQSKVQVDVEVGQITGFQLIKRIAHLFFVDEKSRDNNQGARLFRYVLKVIELG